MKSPTMNSGMFLIAFVASWIVIAKVLPADYGGGGGDVAVAAAGLALLFHMAMALLARCLHRGRPVESVV